MAQYTTRFGSLLDYEKGGVEAIDDEPHHYAFSNMFEVGANAKAWEKVAVAKNQQYVLEVVRAEGTSGWRTAAHDEFALVMDGEVRIELVKVADEQAPDPGSEGSVALDGEPGGQRMGEVIARRGHMTLLPHGAAYRFHADRPGVILMQTIEGPDTVYKWAEIVQTTP
jgi:hypothetical protein